MAQGDGRIYTDLAFADYKALIIAYCDLYADDDGDSDHDTLLEAMFNTAKRKVDQYLNNPFEVLNPTIAFSSVVANDYITVNGQTYTAKDTADEDDLYFALGSTDSETADNFVAYVNSTTLGGSFGAVGVDGVLAANTDGTVTLTRRQGYPLSKLIEVSSADEDRLMVRQVRTEISIPDVVTQWILQFIRRHFDNRAAAIQKQLSGKSLEMYLSMKSEEAGLIDNYDLISQYRLTPGWG